jgi:tRNA acetyltransferase TAN1
VSMGERPPLGAKTTLLVTTPAGLEAEARRELRELLPGVDTRALMLKGNILVTTIAEEDEAIEVVAHADTTCVSRVVPVQRRVAVKATTWDQVAPAAADIGRLAKGDLFLVRCHRRGRHQWQSRDLEKSVAQRLEAAVGATGEYEEEIDWIVSVEVFQDVAFVGVNRPGNILQKRLRRQRKYAPGQRPLNRAQWKIREALSRFEIELQPQAKVLDLGSAPGGWVMVLAERAAEVLAVDPADLDASVASLPNVRHLRRRAEQLRIHDGCSSSFDLLTCDMNLDPREAAAILCQLAPLLKPDAPAIMTIKYVTRARRRHEQEARETLAEEYDGIRIERLPHNARETTAVMRKRESEPRPQR